MFDTKTAFLALVVASFASFILAVGWAHACTLIAEKAKR